jgi:hypothetical protein
MKQDARILVIFGQQPEPGDMVLVEEGLDVPASAPASAQVLRFTAGTPGHLPGCSCCVARSPAASVLAAAFRARATGTALYFTRLLVLASPAGRLDIETALAQDVLCRARFRLKA